MVTRYDGHKQQVVKPFLKKGACFLPLLGEKRKKCKQKTAKSLIMSYSTCPALQISIF